jgi:hypothetical protein
MLLVAIVLYPFFNLIKDFILTVEAKNFVAMFYNAMSFVLWAMVSVVVMAIVQFLLTFAPYAIVIDGNGTLTGIKKGFWVLRRNFSDTVIMWLLVGVAGMALQVPLYPFKLLGVWGVVVGTIAVTLIAWILVMPITTCWWVELYRRGSKKET